MRALAVALAGLAITAAPAQARLSGHQVDRLYAGPALEHLEDGALAITSAVLSDEAVDDSALRLDYARCNHRPGLYRCPVEVHAGGRRCKVWLRATAHRWRTERRRGTCPQAWRP